MQKTICFIIYTLMCPLFANAADRMQIDGSVIIFDTNKQSDKHDDGINYEDANELKRLLSENPMIKTLKITSGGGFSGAAYEISRTIIDYSLDTIASNECVSACFVVFLSGVNRIVEKGTSIGLHGSYWTADSLKKYFDDCKESNGWANEMAFAAWVYEEGRRDAARAYNFLADRKVKQIFIDKMMSLHSDQYWYPTRQELIMAGVIN